MPMETSRSASSVLEARSMPEKSGEKIICHSDRLGADQWKIKDR
jgi:hypothetical protein